MLGNAFQWKGMLMAHLNQAFVHHLTEVFINTVDSELQDCENLSFTFKTSGVW